MPNVERPDTLSPEDQSQVIEFLLQPETHHVEKVEHLETHISHIFLAGDLCYKLKRSIKLEFLDYSTLPQRETACRRELEINQQFAPQLYRGLVPITLCSDGTFELDGPGEVVDWLVEMNRFDQQDQLDNCVREHRLIPIHVEQLAEVIADNHKRASYRRETDAKGVFRKTAANIERMLQKAPAGRIDPNARHFWWQSMEEEIAQHGDLINRRGRHGFIRQCHADLHLANIVLLDDQPTPFDAIEFDEDLTWIDILYDIAFTVMDLIYFDEAAHANLLLNRYLEITRDYAGLALLPAFISLRAAIRAMAHAFAETPQSTEAAQKYMKLATDMLDMHDRPQLFAIGGVSGTGKSTMARALSAGYFKGPGAIILRSDAIRKRMFGFALTDVLNEQYYSSEISKRVYARMFVDVKRALKAGFSVITDATFLHPLSRDAVRSLSIELNVPFQGVWLQAPVSDLEQRLGQRTGDASDADFNIAKAQMSDLSEPDDWLAVDTSNGTEAGLAQILKALES